jgi:hypothetical protein
MYASFLVSLYGSLFYVHNLSLLVETRRTQYLAEHTTLQNILPCRTYYLAEHTTLCYRVDVRRIAYIWRGGGCREGW